MDRRIPANLQKIAGSRGGHYGGSIRTKRAQAGEIEMVHMRVREQHYVRRRNLGQRQRRSDDSPDTQRYRAYYVQPDPFPNTGSVISVTPSIRRSTVLCPSHAA